MLQPVPIPTLSLERFENVLGDLYEVFQARVEPSRLMLEGRRVWHINSTAAGGGVAEMLRSLLAYARGAGVDVRWMVIQGDEEFFRITKRLHNHLHGVDGDGGSLDAEQADHYERTEERNASELAELVKPGDIVYLHDPQTAGMVEAMERAGALVIWRCHIGLDNPNDTARRAWEFLRAHIEPAHAWVFSRQAFAWDGLDPDRIAVIPPSIDAFSAKNQDMAPEAVGAILAQIGLSGGPAPGDPVFIRQDGSTDYVRRAATIDQDAPLPADVRVAAQVSRWDRLKDPVGVLEGFAEHVDAPGSHLVLVGPDVEAVADDPEGAEVLAQVREAWAGLDPETHAQVHLVSLPMEDREENAAMVNAIQRRADVIIQKSLAEGFGLTATEGMWKGKPVVTSRIGGLQEQVLDGKTGLLVEPRDLAGFGAAVTRLLRDPIASERMGEEAREHVRREYLGARHLVQYADLLADMID
jgi:trehalose synthase